MADSEQVAVSEENELAREAQLAAYRTLRDAFLALFGPVGKPTVHGAIVLEHLERFAGTRRLINETDTNGQTDIYRTARKHGRCDMIQVIYDALEWKEPSDANSSNSGG